jgi:hypothetical protein
MTVLISTILTSNLKQIIDVKSLMKSFRFICPKVKYLLESNTDGIIMLNCEGCQVAIAPMPAPYPWSDLEGPCNTSLLWPDAVTAVRGHKGHILVTCLSDKHDEIEMNTTLSQATAAVAHSLSDSLGVYWGNSTSVIRKDIFIDMMKEILPEGPPLMVWVDIRAGKNDDGTTSAFTTGLHVFGHMEIETSDSPLKPGDLRDQIWSFAEYLILNGPVVEDGNTIGGNENEMIKVKYDSSNFGIEGKIMRLVHKYKN